MRRQWAAEPRPTKSTGRKNQVSQMNKLLVGKHTTQVNARARGIQEAPIRAVNSFFHTEVLDFQAYHAHREHTHNMCSSRPALFPAQPVRTKGQLWEAGSTCHLWPPGQEQGQCPSPWGQPIPTAAPAPGPNIPQISQQEIPWGAEPAPGHR